jgi:hypothetical protein
LKGNRDSCILCKLICRPPVVPMPALSRQALCMPVLKIRKLILQSWIIWERRLSVTLNCISHLPAQHECWLLLQGKTILPV